MSMDFGPGSETVAVAVARLVRWIKNALFVLGVLALLFLDVFLGIYFLMMGFNTLEDRWQFILGLFFSLATSAVQIAVWVIVDRQNKRRDPWSPGKIAAWLGVILLMALDLVSDLGGLSQLMYPEAGEVLFYRGATPVFWIIAVMALTMTTLNEPILAYIVRMVQGEIPADTPTNAGKSGDLPSVDLPGMYRS